MQLIFILVGSALLFVGGLLQFYGGPEVEGLENWGMMVFGLFLLLGGIGMGRHDERPAPAPAAKREPEHEPTLQEEREAAYQLGKTQEARYWRNPKGYDAQAAAQFRAYIERGRPDLAKMFTDAFSENYKSVVSNGAKKIREWER